MKWTPSSPSSSSGFTLLELMVASLLGLVVAALCLDSALVQKRIMGRDTVRTRLNQNLRGAIDVLGSDARVAGENLNAAVPALELTNGANSGPDTLVLRRNLSDVVLNNCTTIAAGAQTTKIYLANSTTQSGCIYSAEASKYNAWRNYRLAHDNAVDAFIFDSVSRQGEFFRYNGEASNSTSYWITRPQGVFSRTYTRYTSWIFIMEEWTYGVSGDLFRVVRNRDTANPFNVSFGITAFQVSLLLNDGSTRTSYAATDDWTKVSLIDTTLSGSDTFERVPIIRSATGRFFPRNVLSN
jgi:prepilin-type N-terminal cleavage/methylation domain-containing protein